MYNFLRIPKGVIFATLGLALALVISCGSSAPEPMVVDREVVKEVVKEVPVDREVVKEVVKEVPVDREVVKEVVKEVPVDRGQQLVPTAAPASVGSPVAAKPTGTLNSAVVELGRFNGHPTLAQTPGTNLTMGTPIGEALLRLGIDGEHQGWLLESWSISEDFTTWTLNLHQGVQFHKGYGEMTAEDMIWSYADGWAENPKKSRTPAIKAFWSNPEGSLETPDPYTIVVNTGAPRSAIGVKLDWMMPASSGTWVASKRQTEEIGVEAANREPALTGPWEMVEESSATFWRMQAVEDHWRQTPYFAEFVLWEIREEATRLAGFRTGKLDTFSVNYDSIPAVESVPGAKIMRMPGGPVYVLHFYGNWLVEALAGEPQPGWDPELPWVSSSADVNSEEWQRAVKVRQALIMAIDREAIRDTILGGYVRLGTLRGFRRYEHLLEGREWEYNPDKARQLMAEAGYADGFSISLAPTIRNAPGEIALCETVATMWQDELGLDVKIERVAWAAIVPRFRGRTFVGAACQGASSKVAVPGAGTVLLSTGKHSHGATHPFIEDIFPRITAEPDDAKRNALEAEYGAFLMDNALAETALFYGDIIWPVGPKIEEWKDHVNAMDMRSIGGYEFIQHRR